MSDRRDTTPPYRPETHCDFLQPAAFQHAFGSLQVVERGGIAWLQADRGAELVHGSGKAVGFREHGSRQRWRAYLGAHWLRAVLKPVSVNLNDEPVD